MDRTPPNYALETAISKRSRARFTLPFPQDWTIIKHTSEQYTQFVDKTVCLEPPGAAKELHIVPLTIGLHWNERAG